MMGNEPLPNKCQSLIDQANAHGGNDNITVIMAEFSGSGLPLAAPEAPIEVREFRQEDFAGRM
jgi:serine/threonine protein phosphatase PrpC